MAATKTRGTNKSGRRSTSGSSIRSSASAKRTGGSKSRSSSSRTAGSRSSGSSASRSAASGNGSARGSGNGVARAARKVKTPLIAGGAALAGAAGGLALGTRQSRSSKVMGVRMPRRPRMRMRMGSRGLAKAAKGVGEFGAQMGELASELRKNREQTDGSKNRSPVEVVLDGLTSRGRHS